MEETKNLPPNHAALDAPASVIFVGFNQVVDKDIAEHIELAAIKFCAATNRKKPTVAALSQNNYMGLLRQYEFGRLPQEEQQKLLKETVEKTEEEYEKEKIEELGQKMAENGVHQFNLKQFKTYMKEVRRVVFSNKEAIHTIASLCKLNYAYVVNPTDKPHQHTYKLYINPEQSLEKIDAEISVIDKQIELLKTRKSDLKAGAKDFRAQLRSEKKAGKKKPVVTENSEEHADNAAKSGDVNGHSDNEQIDQLSE